LGQAKRRPNAPDALLAVLGLRYRSTQPTAATQGFTLIEALVAIVVLALSLSALLSAHNTALRGASVVDEHLQARLLAQSLVAQWTVSRALPAPSHGQSGRFAWSVSVGPLAEAGAAVKAERGHWALHELTVTVRWAPNRHIALSTLRLLAVP
jgi:prepilin-type N-terminal cleavage/methylation domain-containing protein